MSGERAAAAGEAAELRARIAELELQLEEMFTRHSPVELFIDPESGAIVDANAAAAAFYGWSVDELTRMRISDINQLPRELVEREMQRARAEQRNYFEFKHRLRSGEVRDVQVFSGPVHVRGRVLLYSVITDISERKRLAEQLAHVQRMEALGRMAGGLAHDFNNLLTATQILADSIRRRVARNLSVDPEVSELEDLVMRGAGLTRQLLAFCRRQVMSTVLVDAAELVRGAEHLLSRLLGERIELVLDFRVAHAPVVADPTQLEQVLMNLCLNARDAMAAGGRVELVLDEERLDGARAVELAVPPGRYLRLSVRDTGVGIAPDLLAHVFEPFFTTKPAGEGTGLGLATVYGIAHQLGGAVSAESEAGRGATFHVWLPRADEAAPALTAGGPITPGRAVGGHETIVLAENDPAILRALRELLEQYGYRVLAVADGVEGLAVARAFTGPIHLLLADVAMPRVGGPELARELTRLRPDVRVLFMSGHVDTPAVDQGLLGAAASILVKPFSVEALLAKIREVLDTPPRRPG